MFASVPQSLQDAYDKAMANSMADKLFFTPYTPSDVFVDIGCADGTLLKALEKTGAHLVGLDICPDHLAKARKNLPNAQFANNWDQLNFLLEPFLGQRITLIASSVIHEVYAYGGEEAGEEFWKNVNRGPWQTLVIRDMAVSSKAKQTKNQILGEKVRQKAPSWQISDFENKWGSLDVEENLLHFFLTYRYTRNWKRELNENYLPLCVEDIDAKVKDWTPILQSHEVLPFLADRLKEELDMSFPSPTHIKRILKRGK